MDYVVASPPKYRPGELPLIYHYYPLRLNFKAYGYNHCQAG